MTVQNIIIEPEADGWRVRSEGALFERFAHRRDAVRQAAALARRVTAGGGSAVVLLKSTRGERTRIWDPLRRSAGL